MFNPYNLKAAFCAGATEAPPIATDVDIKQLVTSAAEEENRRFQENADDAEGMEVALGPPSPLTDVAYDLDVDAGSGAFRRSPTRSSTPTTPTPQPFVLGSAEKKRKKKYYKDSRQRKRIRRAEAAHQPDHYSPNPRVVDSCFEQADTVNINGDAANLARSSEGAWVGKRQPGIGEDPWNLTQLQKLSFRTIKWDGKETIFILDLQTRIVAVLVGQPIDPEWPKICAKAAKLMLGIGTLGLESEAFLDKYCSHRRGDFVALPAGVSFGGGQTKPGNMVHSNPRQILINRLLASKSIQRIAGFQSSAFAAYAPKLYQYFASTLSKLFNFHSGLSHNFANSIFPAVSFNLGPQSVSLNHVDHGNLSHGLCALTALGSYDPQLGGHLVLFPFRLAVEFPPGSTILIPSGCVDHGNTPIQEGETRMSIAQYAAGGLFRWVSYGFRTAKSLLGMKAGRAKKEKIDMEEGERWKLGLLMFSKHGELLEDMKKVYNN